MPEAPDRAQAVNRWISLAEHDLGTAEQILASGKPYYEVVCFHAQQSAEKYLKALLIGQEVTFPRTHDLRRLLELVPADVHLNVPVRELSQLNRYSVQTRYPENWDDLEPSDAREAIATARLVRDAVLVVVAGK